MAGPNTLGVTWGDPWSAFTYSGVPWHLFEELDDLGVLVGRANANQSRPSDLARGAVDLRHSLERRRPKRNALWRYYPETIELLGDRFAGVQAAAPDHEVVLQFGVAGIPRHGALVAHVEIPVDVAAHAPTYARSYGFEGFSDRTVARAVEGEQAFLDTCSIVWTNTPWTAGLLVERGCPASKVRWYPPGCGMDDPGPVERDWRGLHVLFVGKEWGHKGGPELLAAFRRVRAERPDATLTVVGCEPDVHEPGVDVLGYLHKDDPRDTATFHRAMQESTVFCMPSLWESTGVVYMEAGLYGLPTVMVAGQGRAELFPPEAAVVLDDREPERLAAALLELAGDPDRMRSMGEAGRQLVLDNYMWPTVAARVAGFVAEARAMAAS